MKKKIFLLFVLSLLMVSVMSVGVAAQYTQPKDVPSIIGEWLGKFVDVIAQLNTKVFKLPLFNMDVTYLALILTFAAMFAILYPASGYIPIFKGGDNLTTRKTFSIALAIMITFMSPVAGWIYFFFNVYVSALVSYGLTIAAVLLFWMITKYSGRGFANLGRFGAETGKLKAETKRMNQETSAEKTMIKREDGAIKDLEKLVEVDENDIKTTLATMIAIKTQISRIDSVTTQKGMALRDQLVKQLSNLLQEENAEQQINERMERILGQEINDMTKLEQFLKLGKSDVNRMATQLATGKFAKDEATAQRLIQNAIRNAEIMLGIHKQVKAMLNTEKQYESIVRQETQALIEDLRSNNLDEAMRRINLIIKEINKENSLMISLDNAERQLRRMDKTILVEIKKILPP